MPTIVHFEVTPLYDWKMYAFPVQPHPEYDAYVLHYNGKVYNKPHTFQDYQRMMINYTLPHYAVMKQTGDTLPFYTRTSYIFLAAFKWNPRDNRLHTTPQDLQQYPLWLKRYVQQQVGEPVHDLSVARISLRYDAENHVQPVATEAIITE